MHKSMVLILLTAVVAAVTCGAVSFAQAPPAPPILPEPDMGVRGTGAISAPLGAMGVLDVNVWSADGSVYGGFQYREMSPAVRRSTTIVAKSVTEIDVEGNSAIVKAIGMWNGMPANITVEALDGSSSGDWFRIVAVPIGPMTIIFERSGGLVKGDLVVFSQPPPPPPDLRTKGQGVIAVRNGFGKFQFSAESIGGVVTGSLLYAEVSPLVSPMPIRPNAHITLRMVRRLDVVGNIAVFSGIGTFNAVPALIEVRVTDNSMLDSPVPIPDQFAIRATSAATTSFPPEVLYEAGGPLRGGDIIVVTVTPMPTP